MQVIFFLFFLQDILTMERRCLKCSEANLFKEGCLDSLHPKDSETILLYHNRSSASFEALRQLPANKHKMKSKGMKYMCNHSENDCYYNSRNCIFPHSKLEEEVWNLLLYSPEKSPEAGLPDRTALISYTEVSMLQFSVCNICYALTGSRCLYSHNEKDEGLTATVI